jgi:hypothetical protein
MKLGKGISGMVSRLHAIFPVAEGRLIAGFPMFAAVSLMAEIGGADFTFARIT